MSKSDFFRFNLGHLITIVIWASGLIYYGGKIENRVSSLDDVVKIMHQEASRVSEKASSTDVRLARIEEKVNYIYEEIRTTKVRAQAQAFERISLPYQTYILSQTQERTP